jgi:glycosyltransferase involved in cell wall biosynthesis
MTRRIDPEDFTLTVVIPVFNETETFDELLGRVLATPYRKQVVVIDDCSTDGSIELVKKAAERHEEVEALFHEVNRGKGAALRSGFAAAKGEIVLVQDADLEYDPAEYSVLLGPILDGRADVVYGSRFLSGAHRVLLFWHMIGNKVLTLYSNMLTNINLTDMEVCYKVFTRPVVDRLVIKENRFGFEPEVTARVAAMGCRIYEVGISYSGRTFEEGKKIGAKDAVRAVWCILKYNLILKVRRPERLR